MKIGLVTVLYKSDNVLPDFFKSVANQTYKNYVLILVDNSPSIGTKKIIEELNILYNLPLLHLEMESNIGVAAANNVGIRSAFLNECNDILILNNDIVFSQQHCFEDIILLSRSHSIIVPKIYYYNSKIDRYRRFHKFGFGKNNLKKRFPELDYNKTEKELTSELGYDRIWDCGLYKYELSL
jgi:GT2 family glycosyltransferase